MQEKNSYSITKVAKMLDVSPDTLRRWESKGIVKPTRGPNNVRQYSLNDLGKLKAHIQQATPQSYTIQQAAKELKVSPGSIRRWEREGKIKTIRTPGGHRRFSFNDIQKIKKSVYSKPTIPQPIPAPSLQTTSTTLSQPQPTPQPTPQTTASGLEEIKVNEDDKKQPEQKITKPTKNSFSKTKPFAYATIFAVLLLLIGGGFILNRTLNPTSTDDRSQASYDLSQSNITQPSSNTSPTSPNNPSDVGSFLGGKITIGSDEGLLSSLDQNGNLNVSGDVSVGGTISFLPQQEPLSPSPGDQYFDSATNTIKYYNGSSWISLTNNLSNTSLQTAYDNGNTITTQGNDLNIALGSGTAFSVSNQSAVNYLTVSESLTYPITISQNTQIGGTLQAGAIKSSGTLDVDGQTTIGDGSSSVAIDSNTWDITADGALSGITDINSSGSLTFSQNGEVLSNGDDGYIT
ncbi:MerR family DNA-binding transcriptional regulator, partial [Patescibacteria group bacterium]